MDVYIKIIIVYGIRRLHYFLQKIIIETYMNYPDLCLNSPRRGQSKTQLMEQTLNVN